MGAITGKRRESRPLGVPRLDANNPLCAGLLFAATSVGGRLFDVVSQRFDVRSGAASAIGVDGQAPMYGSGSHSDFAAPAEFDGARPFTIAWRQRPMLPSGYSTVLDVRPPVNASNSFLIYQSAADSSYQFVVGPRDGGGTGKQAQFAMGLQVSGQLDVYVLVAPSGLATASAAYVLYRNGVRQAAAVASPAFGNAAPAGMRIGSVLGSPGDPFEGLLYDLRIAGRAWSDDEAIRWTAGEIDVWARRRIMVAVGAAGGPVTNTATTSLAAAIQQINAASAGMAAGIQTSRVATTSANAAVQAAALAQASLEAAVKNTRTAVASIDAQVQAGSTASTSATAAVQLARSAVAALDLAAQAQRTNTAAMSAQVQAGSTATLALDAYVQAGASVSVAASAAVLAKAVATAGMDAGIMAPGQVSAGMSAALRAAMQATAVAGAAVQVVGQVGASLTAQVQAGTSQAVAIDVAVRTAAQALAAVDVAVARMASAASSLQAVVSLQRSLVAALDVGVRAGRIAAALASAYVRDDTAAVFTVDGRQRIGGINLAQPGGRLGPAALNASPGRIGPENL